jgi:hypothetical protein
MCVTDPWGPVRSLDEERRYFVPQNVRSMARPAPDAEISHKVQGCCARHKSGPSKHMGLGTSQ